MSASKQRLYHKLQLAAHRLRKSADRVVADATGLNTARISVLSVVANGKTVTQRDVADQLGLNESAVTPMVKTLIDLAYLERTRSASDARTWHLRLTADGKDVLKRVRPPFTAINDRIESVLTPEEVAALADYLKRLGDAFDS